MDADKIKKLLHKYYSGNILPEEYQVLISALKDADELTPELETERRMLLAIESYEPLEPNGFEDRLKMVIDHRSKRSRTFLRIVLTVSVAAIVLAFITIGPHIRYYIATDVIEPTAKLSTFHKVDVSHEIDMKDVSNTKQTRSVAHANPPSLSNASYDLRKSFQIADEALMDVLASIFVAQNEVVELIENIEISQLTDNNTY